MTVDVVGVDFVTVDLVGVDFVTVDLVGIDFVGVDLVAPNRNYIHVHVRCRIRHYVTYSGLSLKSTMPLVESLPAFEVPGRLYMTLYIMYSVFRNFQ